jgi:16S rRNA (guanine(527)-N(7))-methyltransferase GidB
MSAPARADLREALLAGAATLQLDLGAAQVDQLLAYLDLLQKWNKVYNLTAVRDPAEMLTHHLLDSLAVIRPLRQHTQGRAARLLDVGSGGGLPGVVVAICCPEIDVTCVDTVAKKAAFVQQVAVSLRLANLHGLHARVESLQAEQGGGYDVVCARAFASLADFVQWSRAALRLGACRTLGVESENAPRRGQFLPDSPPHSGAMGQEDGKKWAAAAHSQPTIPKSDRLLGSVWLAMKGKHPADEIAALPPWAEVFHVEPLQVPGLHAERCIVWLRERAQVAGINPAC